MLNKYGVTNEDGLNSIGLLHTELPATKKKMIESENENVILLKL
jgi:hypothetical protein